MKSQFTDVEPVDYASVVVDNSMLMEIYQEPWVATEDIHGLDYDVPSHNFCAEMWTTNYHICEGVEHTKCPAGQEAIGRETVDEILCGPCAPGTFEPGGRGKKCQPCPEGMVAAEEGAASCTPCPAGSAPSTDKTVCVKCSPGTFSSQEGTVCMRVRGGACESLVRLGAQGSVAEGCK